MGLRADDSSFFGRYTNLLEFVGMFGFMLDYTVNLLKAYLTYSWSLEVYCIDRGCDSRYSILPLLGRSVLYLLSVVVVSGRLRFVGYYWYAPGSWHKVPKRLTKDNI